MAKHAVVITGQPTLHIDDAGVKATLSIIRDENAEDVGVESVLSLLEEQGVTEGFEQRDIEDKLKAASKTNANPIRVVVAEGIAAEDSTAESPQWEPLPVPPELADDVDGILASADPPVIYTERVETVKREKTVEKKPKLPFMGPKKERVTVSEKTVKRERVYVDPTVEDTGYAEAGAMLAAIQPSHAGSPGRSIFGKILQPDQVTDPHFYHGEGVSRRQQELIADRTGIVRKGRNWVDIVPFAGHDWEVELSEDRATCVLSFNPGHSYAAAPTVSEIRARAEELEYPLEALIPDAEIQRIVDRALHENRALDHVPITKSRDSSFEIRVSDDKLSAVLNISKGSGRGSPLDLKALGKAIKESKLRGLDLDKIKTDIMEFYRGHDRDLFGYVLAEGTPPETGPDQKVEYSVRFLANKDKERILSQMREYPENLEDVESLDVFPMDAILEMAMVEKEHRILATAPPMEGQAGEDVYGNAIPGRPGSAPKIELLENLEETQNVVFSTVSGILDMGEIDGVTYLRVREHVDARIGVVVAEDRMAAALSLYEGTGSGRRLTEDDVREAVSKAGVKKGIDEEVLIGAVRAAKAGEPVRNLTFARGEESRRGGSREIEFLVHVATGADVAIRDDGRADYRNTDKITVIKAGTEFARIHLPKDEPEPGWDVTGRQLPAPKTSDLELTIGENVQQHENDDDTITLTAAKSGELVYEKNSIDIRPIHRVQGDVDLHSGNIKFPGSVEVTGSVHSGFVVMATGDVKIGEGVDAALVSGDGDISVAQGVRGGGKAVLRTKGSITAAFAEQAVLLSVADIEIKNSIMQCKVKCNGRLTVKNDKGSIVGGEIKVRNGLEVHNLGSNRGIKTQVTFGQDYLIADQIEREEKEIESTKQRITEVDLDMKRSEKVSNRESLQTLRDQKRNLMRVLEKRSLRLFTLRERFEEHFPSEIVVTGTLFPGVTFESHGRTMEVTAERKAVAISFEPEQGRLIERSLKES